MPVSISNDTFKTLTVNQLIDDVNQYLKGY